MLVENGLRTIAGKNSVLGDTSVGEALKPKTAIGMGHYSTQDLVLLGNVSELDPWGHQMATAGHENQTVEAPRLGAPGTGALLAAVAVADIALETSELAAHQKQKQSVDPDNGRLPCNYRPVEVSVVAAHDHHSIPGRGEEAVGACQRQTTSYVSCLGQALVGRRTMSWFGTSQEGGQHQRCLRTRHLVGSYHSDRDNPAGVGQEEPVSCIDSRPYSLRKMGVMRQASYWVVGISPIQPAALPRV